MLEFKTIETLKPNIEILETVKDYTYKVKKGTIKPILHTNLQVIEPIEFRSVFLLLSKETSEEMIIYEMCSICNSKNTS